MPLRAATQRSSAKQIFLKTLPTACNYINEETTVHVFSWEVVKLSEAAFRRRSSKFRNIHRKPPVLEFVLNKLAGLQANNFIKKRLQHRCFLVNITKFLEHAFLQNTSGYCFWTFRNSFFTEHPWATAFWLHLQQTYTWHIHIHIHSM